MDIYAHRVLLCDGRHGLFEQKYLSAPLLRTFRTSRSWVAMKVTKEQARLVVLITTLVIVNAMTLVMLIARLRMAQDSGMAMGVGFMNLFFFSIGFPLLIMLLVLRPRRAWWTAILPSFFAFFFLTFI